MLSGEGVAAQRGAGERAHHLWVAGDQCPCSDEERKVFVWRAVLRHEEVAQWMPSQLRLDALPGGEAPGEVDLAVVERLENVQFPRGHQLDGAAPAVRDDQIR